MWITKLGYGNSKLVGFSSNREARINLEDAIFDNEVLALLTGNSIETGAQTIHWNEVVTLGAASTATLTHTPEPTDTLTSVYEANADGTNGTELDEGYDYTVSGKTLTCSGHTEGDRIRVYYQAETDATAKMVKVTSSAFGGTFKIVLQVLIRDEYTKEDYMGELVIPNGKFEDNFDLSLN